MIDQGISGTIEWTLEDDGILYFTPVFGNDGTFALSDGHGGWHVEHNSGYDWNKYYQNIKRIKSDGIIHLAKDSSYMFAGCSYLTDLEGLKNFDTKNVKYMSCMFKGCSSLVDMVVLKNFNTQNVLDMDNMFDGCSSLTTIGFSDNNKNIIDEIPYEETSALSRKWHKIGTTQEYSCFELAKNWNSSFEGVWSREQISKPAPTNDFQIVIPEGEIVTLLIKDKALTVKPVGGSVQISYK